MSGGGRQKSRGRGKKRKNGGNRRKNKNNFNSNRKSENGNNNNNNNNNNRKRGRGDPQQPDLVNEEEEEQTERTRQARDLSTNNNSDFERELENDNSINLKKDRALNSSQARANGDELGQDAKLIKTNGKFGKRVESYGGLNYTLAMKEGEGSAELQRWRRRLRELLGEEVGGSDGKEENMVRRRVKYIKYIRI